MVQHLESRLLGAAVQFEPPGPDLYDICVLVLLHQLDIVLAGVCGILACSDIPI